MTKSCKTLTMDELAVLRELARWRRNHGHEYVSGHGLTPIYRLTDGRAISWLGPQSQATCMKIGVTRDYHRDLFTWHRVDSIAEALDLLVTYGYLPPRFSSAYRAGWDARSSFETSHADPDIMAEMTGEEPRPSFPAWRPAW